MVPSRRRFNQLYRETTGMLHEINRTGIPPWSASIGYEHTAFVVHNGVLWISSQDSTGQEPSPSSEHWRPY